MSDLFLQLALFFAGAIIGIVVLFLDKKGQKRLLAVLSLLLIVVSMLWARSEITSTLPAVPHPAPRGTALPTLASRGTAPLKPPATQTPQANPSDSPTPTPFMPMAPTPIPMVAAPGAVSASHIGFISYRKTGSDDSYPADTYVGELSHMHEEGGEQTVLRAELDPPCYRGPFLAALVTSCKARLYVFDSDVVVGWSPSPGGTRMAYEKDNHGFMGIGRGNRDVYVSDINGRHESRLTGGSFDDRFPSWSPDGTRIAFTSDRNGRPEIYVMATDGANQTRLTQNIDPQGADICPSWSPDGGQLVFASVRATGSGIYRVNADGSNLTQLIHEELSTRDVVCPVFSPDGMRIAYSTATSLSLRNASQIVVINRDGTAPMRLSSDSQNDTAPAWSLDGSKIAFMSGPNRPWQICIMNASGANRRCLTDDDTEHIFPKWMP